jgi:hypothetical protein
MADYYTQLVVQQTIPSALISPFEQLLLSAMLEHEQTGEEIYYFASEQVRGFPSISRIELTEVLAASPQRSRLKTFVSEQIARHPDDCPHVDLDFTASVFGSDAHLIILQDIVRRSKGALPYLTIGAAYTCSKMRPDGFGGMCIMIAPRAIRYWSTYDVLERFTARFEKSQAAKAPHAVEPSRPEAAPA